jgi:multiple sugar transport system ATP-binding protein
MAGAVTAGVRAEHVHLHADGAAPAGGVRAQVKRIEILSDQRLVHLMLADSAHELVSAAPDDSGLEPGASVAVEPRRVLWFDALGQRIAA